jgi:protein-L-isoaspartate(D-aspartate) O-methyltransferase
MEDNYKHKGLRTALVNYLKDNGMTDQRVLQALAQVPRHWFLESAFLGHAYQDKAFAIGEGQTISQPSTVAFQTHLLGLQPGQKVLEVGTGSGYQAAVLAELGAKVYTIECNRKLHEHARQLLKKIGYKNIQLFFGDGSLGLAGCAPFDAVLVTAGAPNVPPALVEQLAEGGRLVIPVGNREAQQMLRLTKQPSGQATTETFDNFVFVPLLGKFGWVA